MEATERRIGLEQEFFLVDGEGVPSDRADKFLSRCREMAAEEGLEPESFVEEVSRSIIEINNPPARTIAGLAETCLASLDLALRAGREIGVRLYPLATYPLPVAPTLREDPSYELQIRTIGHARFLNAARCAGVHLHLELPTGTVDPDTVVSSDATPAAREELLNLYNLATALDPALVALTRACPFYEGLAPGLAVRTAFYRGSTLFGWEGLYTNLPEVGILRPYALSVEELVKHGLASYRVWLGAMDRAGVERRTFFETGGNVLKASWNPVRLNQHGTVELRGMDGNYPQVVLAVAALIHATAYRVREEGLIVEPDDQTYVFEVDGDRLLVPGFEYLGKSLFYATATVGMETPEVSAYLDSIVEFATPEGTGLHYLSGLGAPYNTTEAEILAQCPRNIISKDEGLRLIRESCNELEEQVASLRRKLTGVSAET